jgi:hypothetical protein
MHKNKKYIRYSIPLTMTIKIILREGGEEEEEEEKRRRKLSVLLMY